MESVCIEEEMIQKKNRLQKYFVLNSLFILKRNILVRSKKKKNDRKFDLWDRKNSLNANSHNDPLSILSSLRTRSWKKIAFKHLFQPNYFNLSSLIVRQFLVKEPMEPLEELMEE